MTTPVYARSTDGSDSDNGSTWALAKATITSAITVASTAGDVVYASSVHAEANGAAAVTFTSPGNAAGMSKILSVNDAAEPPTTLAAGASVSNTGNNQIIFNGTWYTFGLVINASSSTSIAIVYFGNNNQSQYQIHEAMKIRCVGSSNGSGIYVGRDGAESGLRVQWINTSVKFSASAQGINGVTSALLEWRNGVNGGSAVGIESGGTAPSSLFKNIGDHDASTTGRSARVLVEGVDLSNGGSSMNICTNLTGGSSLVLRNCKLPSAWSGSLVASNCEHGAVAMMINCDNGDTNYKFRHQTRGALLRDETTLVMSGGATDGDTPVSWKVVTNTVCGPGAIWSSPEMHVELTSTGAAKTITVEILHDSATNLTDDEIWVEVDGLGTASSTLGIGINDRKADALASAADQASSSATWTTTGMSNPNKQKLSVSFTPQKKGYAVVRVFAAKASKTFYMNPEPIVS